MLERPLAGLPETRSERVAVNTQPLPTTHSHRILNFLLAEWYTLGGVLPFSEKRIVGATCGREVRPRCIQKDPKTAVDEVQEGLRPCGRFRQLPQWWGASETRQPGVAESRYRGGGKVPNVPAVGGNWLSGLLVDPVVVVSVVI